MRYLTIAADYSVSCLKDDFTGPLEPDDLKLPAALAAALSRWNERYKSIIPLDMDQRTKPDTAELIDRLDQEGQELANQVREAVGEAKVRYYSEGHLKYLW